MIYCIINIIGNIILFASVAFLIGKAAWEWNQTLSFTDKRDRIKRRLYKWAEKGEQILLLISAKIPFLKIIYISIALAIGAALVLLFIPLYSQVLSVILSIKCNILETCDSPKLNETQIRNLAFAFLGTVSGIAALFGGYLAILRANTNERQATTEEQGLITDRINKAIERLSTNDEKGKPIIEVRLGALYALERIAQDSIRDHIQIMDILCAYVKTNSPLPKKKKPLRKDVQIALNIIGWRANGHDGKKRLKKERRENYYIDLNYCDLHGAEFNKANLSGAEFNRANLDGASFYDSDLSNAFFRYAKLNKVYIDNTNMTSANFNWAEIIEAGISESNLTTTGLSYANMSKTTIANRSNLYNAQFLKTDMSNTKLYNIDMTDAILFNANFKDAKINDSNLNHTSFYKTNMKGADTTNSYAYEGDFSDYKNLTKKQINSMFCGIDVGIPSHLKKRPKHWPTEKLHKDFFMKAYWKWCKEQSDDPRYDPEYSSKSSTLHMPSRKFSQKSNIVITRAPT